MHVVDVDRDNRLSPMGFRYSTRQPIASEVVMPTHGRTSLARQVWRGLAIGAAIVMLLAVGGLLFRAPDAYSAERMALTAMVQSAGPVEDRLARCAVDGRTPAACVGLDEVLRGTAHQDRTVFVTSAGAIVGIDFARRTTVILEPERDANRIRWRCAGFPKSALSASCALAIH